MKSKLEERISKLKIELQESKLDNERLHAALEEKDKEMQQQAKEEKETSKPAPQPAAQPAPTTDHSKSEPIAGEDFMFDGGTL